MTLIKKDEISEPANAALARTRRLLGLPDSDGSVRLEKIHCDRLVQSALRADVFPGSKAAKKNPEGSNLG
jgi:hypothetical protein